MLQRSRNKKINEQKTWNRTTNAIANATARK